MRRTYVGLACTAHDSAIAVVDGDGEVVYAEATERPLQSKRAFHAPPDDLGQVRRVLERWCDLDGELVVATTWSMGPWKRRLFRAYERLLTWRGFRHPHREVEWAFIRSVLRGTVDLVDRAAMNLEYVLRDLRPKAPPLVRRAYDHHLTHAALGCFGSPFDEAVCAVLDGYGEGASTAMFHYTGGRLRPIAGAGRSADASPGIFYSRLCKAAGFDPVHGEEWKVMGLAGYGAREDALYEVLRPMLRVDGLGLARDPGMHDAWAKLYARSEAEVLAARPDLAHTGQLVFAEVIGELLTNLRARGLSKNLVLGGGCALNSSFNGEVLRRTGFDALHVASAPADDGNAVGAALLAYREDHPEHRPAPRALTPYLGSSLSEETLDRVEALGGLVNVRPKEVPVEEYAAGLLADGKILGWAQGRAELGPRALGHRSILADPRAPDVKDCINARVKFREEFRPFAPSILHEHGPAWFEDYAESPYMERTLRFRPEVRAKVPGVVHVDGTGRLQTVKAEWSPRYHALVEAFWRRTGVPMVLNTSFNVMGKPIVHSVEDALAVFFTTGLDALVVGDRVYVKGARP